MTTFVNVFDGLAAKGRQSWPSFWCSISLNCKYLTNLAHLV